MTDSEEQREGLIRVLTGEYRAAEIRLKNGETIKIGRAADNDLVLKDQKSVSHYHCTITWYAHEETFGVSDISSSGTRREDTGAFLPKDGRLLRMDPGTVLSIGGVDNQLLLLMDKTEDDSDYDNWAWMYPGMVINNRYVVEKMIAREKRSVTFRCRDITLDMPVSIRSFADDEVTKRDAKNLAKFRSVKGILNVYGVINTEEKSYIVMEYNGWDLLSDRMNEWENPDPVLARRITEIIMSVVNEVKNGGLTEGMINPDNVFVSDDHVRPDVKLYLSVEEDKDGISIGPDERELKDRIWRMIMGEGYPEPSREKKKRGLKRLKKSLLGKQQQ